MEILEKQLDCYLIESPMIPDVQGWFHVPFCAGDFTELGLEFNPVCQLNHSYTDQAGIIRGPNFQKKPFQQAKVVRCTRGALYSVGIDIDINLPTYSQWCGFVLTEENRKLMYIPNTYAHGFVTLQEHTELEYFTDNRYSKEFAASFARNDPAVNIDWTCSGSIRVNPLIMSEKNRIAPLFQDVVF